MKNGRRGSQGNNIMWPGKRGPRGLSLGELLFLCYLPKTGDKEKHIECSRRVKSGPKPKWALAAQSLVAGSFQSGALLRWELELALQARSALPLRREHPLNRMGAVILVSRK